MDGGRVCSGSDVISLLDNSSNSLWVPSSSPSFHETMVNFDQEIQQGRRSSLGVDRHRTTSDMEDGGGDELDMNSCHHPEKKRRLSPGQVQFLEKSFDVENKLEPERKVQLAKELGLQPRQVAIWFQNRRARYKTKQLEKDYGSLKASYDSLNVDYDALLKERDHLQNEVKLLTKKLKQRDMGRANPDPANPLNSEPQIPENETQKGPKMEMEVAPQSIKQAEDASSAKSDVFDSESPHCTEGIHSSMLEDPADSTHLPDLDRHSDFSQDEEDRRLMMSKSLLLPTTGYCNNGFKVEEGFYDVNNGANSTTCNFSFVVEDQPVWSWPY